VGEVCVEVGGELWRLRWRFRRIRLCGSVRMRPCGSGGWWQGAGELELVDQVVEEAERRARLW